jgi:ATP-dependent Clp protease protease subunit
MAKAEQDQVVFDNLDDEIESTLLKSRRILISDGVDADSARTIIRKLWYLDLKEPGKPILFIINSPGGSVDSGFAIWDQVKMLRSPIYTLVTGLAASFGSILSLCAGPGRRFATPHARIMIHQPRTGGMMSGQATDLEIQAREILRTRDTLINIYMEATGKDFDLLERTMDRDAWMSPHEAQDFGLLDGIVQSFDELDKLIAN